MAGITAMLTGLVQSYRNVTVTPSALSQSGREVIGAVNAVYDDLLCVADNAAGEMEESRK